MRVPALLAAFALLTTAAAEERLPVAGTFRTDLSKRSIDLSELTGGGPPKDGIPAIDEPNPDVSPIPTEWG